MSDRESSSDRGGASPPEEPSSMEEGRRSPTAARSPTEARSLTAAWSPTEAWSPTAALDDHEAADETVQPAPIPRQAARIVLPDERRGEFSRGERRDETVEEDSREEHSRAEATSGDQKGATAKENRTSDVVESGGVVKRRRVNPEDLESSRSTLDIEARATEPDDEGFLDSSQLPLAVQQLSSASHQTMGPGVHHVVLENQAVPDLLQENRRLEASGETTQHQQSEDLSVQEEAMSRVSGPSGSGRSADPQTPHSVSDGSGRRETRTQVLGTQPADAGSRTRTWASNPRARFADGGPAADQHQWRVPRAPGGTSLSSRSGRSADPNAPVSADAQSVTSRSTVPSLRGRAEELSVQELATAEMDPGSVSGRSADSSGLHAPVSADGSTEPGSRGNEPPLPGELALDQTAFDPSQPREDDRNCISTQLAAVALRIPLGMDHLPDDTRLAVHGDVVYLLVPWLHRVLRVDLSDPAPSFTPIIQAEYLYPLCLVVTEDGEVVVGGWWSDESGDVQHGIRVYSPAGEKTRRVATDRAVRELALHPAGGIHILTGDLNLQFIENF